MKLEIFGLRNEGIASGEEGRDKICVEVDPETELRQLFADHRGLVRPHRLVDASGKSFDVKGRIKAPLQHKVVEVTDGPSDFFEGKINVRDTFEDFLQFKYPTSPISARLGTSGTAASETLIVDDNLEIRFNRTIRLPDDHIIHPLPDSTGTFSLFNVNAFGNILPEHIALKGGVFFPMWQREAMWIEFKVLEKSNSRGRTQYAVRINLGEINAVTGLSIRDVSETQDYIVVPGQEWIDGILVEPGVVRQFVAMPLGRGYTVESQITGEERVGGLQIEVTPRLLESLRDDTQVCSPGTRPLGIKQSPHERNIPIGSRLTMGWAHHWRNLRVSDLTASPSFATHDSIHVFKALYRRMNSRTARPNTIETSHFFEKVPTRCIAACFRVDSTAESLTDIEIPYLLKEKRMEDNIRNHPGPSKTSPGENPPPKAETLRQMGIAAGGKLVQDIYKDSSSGLPWHKARTRLINVQIFDAATFEAMTHIVPPPTPITAQTYADLGHQFWVVDSNPEASVGPAEALSMIQSVGSLDAASGIFEDTGEVDTTKPTKCKTCEKRLCDCVVRPCNHQFCSECVSLVGKTNTCPTCGNRVKHVAGFSAPMNLPGEETYKVNVPVVMLEVKDGRMRFKGRRRMRM